jgi:dipeptidyl aminopeptidase/acylaminoacyl peptidase
MKNIFFFILLAFTGGTLFAQKDTITPYDNLTIDGVPAVTVQLMEELAPYGETRSAAFASWHPLKREMLISTRFGDTRQIHRVSMPGGARYQLTFFKEQATGASYEPTKGNYFLFNKDIGGNENFQIYRYDVETGKTTLLTDGKSRNTGKLWSNKGDRIVYFSNKRNGSDIDLYIMNPLDPASETMLLELKGGGWGALDWSPDDKSILMSEYISVNESNLWLVDVAAKTKTQLTPPQDSVKIAYGTGRFSADGTAIYFTSDKESEFQRLALMDLKTKSVKIITDKINWDVDELAMSPDRMKMIYMTNENGVSAMHLIDLKNLKEQSLPKLAVGLIGGVDWHANGQEIAFSYQTSQGPTDVYTIDVKKQKIERWTISETGGINVSGLPAPKLIEWKSFDGLKITGFMYEPPAKFAGKRPVVIEIHGGPEAQSQPGFMGRYNYLLNELGITLIFPNIRGSTGFGKTFMKLDNGFKREDSYKDINALFDWIAAQPGLDAGRIMVMGGSYGGHMSLAISTYYSDRIRCAMSYVGISNLVTFLENTSGYRRDLRRVEYGDERDEAMRAFMLKIAPTNNADKIKKPLYIVQGANDPRVPVSEAVQMVETLKKIKTPVWYLCAKDEGHGFAKKKNNDYYFATLVMFMKEHLLK